MNAGATTSTTGSRILVVQVSEPAGAQSASLERCQTLAEFFSRDPAIFTDDLLNGLVSCVAEYRAQRGGATGETESPEMGAGEFSGGTPQFQMDLPDLLNFQELQTPGLQLQE